MGDPAARLGHAAIDRAGAIRSRRLDHYLGELAQQTDPAAMSTLAREGIA